MPADHEPKEDPVGKKIRIALVGTRLLPVLESAFKEATRHFLRADDYELIPAVLTDSSLKKLTTLRKKENSIRNEHPLLHDATLWTRIVLEENKEFDAALRFSSGANSRWPHKESDDKLEMFFSSQYIAIAMLTARLNGGLGSMLNFSSSLSTGYNGNGRTADGQEAKMAAIVVEQAATTWLKDFERGRLAIAA